MLITGDKLSMLDIHMWPWFERMGVSKVRAEGILSGLPKLEGWVQRMQQHPAIQATMTPLSTHCDYMQSFLNNTPNYDVGL